ncbi:MAG TPA: class I SAM-dependent methyltransferase [Acidimicrobiales bacterium]|nr:class I SAM-dependent methyltransferase [Acidimicrobiales bacterium]
MAHWFEAVAAHLGPAYLRYSFTYGTEQEVEFLVDALALTEGMRILDVGCGPGRHALALARRGFEVVGLDISETFVALASQSADAEALPATFVRGDARAMRFDAEFDAVVSLCQGAFGLSGGPFSAEGDPDAVVLRGIARALRPGGRLAVSAFSAYFQVRHLEDSQFDAATGVNHEHTEIRNESGERRATELWTTCFTPRELRLLSGSVGLTVDAVWSVTPGAYARSAPDLEQPEYLLTASRPETTEERSSNPSR